MLDGGGLRDRLGALLGDDADWVSSAEDLERCYDRQKLLLADANAIGPERFGHIGRRSERVVLLRQGSPFDWPVDDFLLWSEADEVLHQRLQLRLRRIGIRRFAHDARTPLGVILGNCQLLSEGILGELSPRQRGAAETIERQALRLNSLIDSLDEG